MTLKEMYTHTIGGLLGTRETTMALGNMYQGKAKSDATSIANLSKKPVQVKVVSEDPALSVAVVPNPIPAGAKASLTYTVNTKNGEKKWGNSEYWASFVLDGKPAAEKIRVTATIADDFDGYTQAQKERGPVPAFSQGYVEIGEVDKGFVKEHTITIKNTGKSQLTIYKAPPGAQQAGVISINIKDFRANEVAAILDKNDDIAVRAGHHCAGLIHKYLKNKEYDGTIRISLGVFNTKEDIDALIDGLKGIDREALKGIDAGILRGNC
jgi:hypothetical protein